MAVATPIEPIEMLFVESFDRLEERIVVEQVNPGCVGFTFLIRGRHYACVLVHDGLERARLLVDIGELPSRKAQDRYDKIYGQMCDKGFMMNGNYGLNSESLVYWYLATCIKGESQGEVDRAIDHLLLYAEFDLPPLSTAFWLLRESGMNMTQISDLARHASYEEGRV